jgi:two-component system chemotaxis response regulator CheY
MATALVVDDSRAVRIILSRTLRELGFEVREAANGREALEVLAERAAVRLVLADWNMPEMNGVELVRRLRQDPDFASLVVVMVTTETELDQMAGRVGGGRQ